MSVAVVSTTDVLGEDLVALVVSVSENPPDPTVDDVFIPNPPFTVEHLMDGNCRDTPIGHS